MPNFVYAFPTAAFYPEIVSPEGSLIAEPGDVCEFENPPTDGRWIETDLPVNDKSGRRWPPAPQAAEATSEEVPAAAPEGGEPDLSGTLFDPSNPIIG